MRIRINEIIMIFFYWVYSQFKFCQNYSEVKEKSLISRVWMVQFSGDECLMIL